MRSAFLIVVTKLMIFIATALMSFDAQAALRDVVIANGDQRGENLFEVVTQTVPAVPVRNAFHYFDLFHGMQREAYVIPVIPDKAHPGSQKFSCKKTKKVCDTAKITQTLFTNTRYMMIFDLDQPSTVQRLHIIDLITGHVDSLYASHGRDSGCPDDPSRACTFISDKDSDATPLGFFMTGQLFFDSKRWVIPLHGLEQAAPGTARNDLPTQIVIHGAPYARQEFLKKYGYLGRSHGCPALSPEDFEKWKNKIKDGALFYFYHSSLPNTVAAPSYILPRAKM